MLKNVTNQATTKDPEIPEDDDKNEDDGASKAFFRVFLCIIFFICLIIFIFIILDVDGSGGGGSWSRGGGCFDSSMIVLAKNESEPDSKAKKIMIKDLEEGDLVQTLDLNLESQNPKNLRWTRATDVDIFWGSWKAHQLLFESGYDITVTSPHLMVIWKKNIGYLVRADNIQIGDEMIVDGQKTKVVKNKSYFISSKVAVETEDGTITVNNVLASGLCDYNPETLEKVVEAEQFLQKYKLEHFGEDHFSNCMDVVAWKNKFLLNNDFPIKS